MIGKVKTGSSFSHLLRYVLEDKKQLQDQSIAGEKARHIGRAEVLAYNLCSGGSKSLTQQFAEVARLSTRTEKPVLHLSLRLAPGEEVSRDILTEMGRSCAEAFDVADHQYICVLHKDTAEQHIHLVANRVGFDGKAASDSNSYRRMADLCRRLEKQYGLTEVLSPRRFLPPEKRKLQRYDSRKEKLKKDIRQALKGCISYQVFEAQIKALGYQVSKGRGIAFTDEKKVRIKGSEVGFSLTTIEKIIVLQVQLAARRRNIANPNPKNILPQSKPMSDRETMLLHKDLANLLLGLARPEADSAAENYNPWKRKKKKQLGL